MPKAMKGSEPIEALLKEGRKFPPPKAFTKAARVKSARIYQEARRNPVRFWERQARELRWLKPWRKAVEWKLPYAKWFVGGKLNVSDNCLDRHVEGPRRNKAAIIWEGEPGDSRVLTYRDLWREVNLFAAALRRHGVKKGDTVTIYMPMIPELPIAMLACARIGAPHNVVFGGFAPESLRDRINDCQAKVVITADGSYRRGGLVPLKKNTDAALTECPQVHTVIVYKRTGQEIGWESGRDVWWDDFVKGAARPRQVRADGLRGHALSPLHLRLHGEAEGDHAHDGRVPHGRVGHPPPDLRPPRGGRVLVHGRHRLGDRALLHRLRAARQRGDHGHVRGHAGLARQGPLLADHREVRRDHPLHGADGHPHLRPVGG